MSVSQQRFATPIRSGNRSIYKPITQSDHKYGTNSQYIEQADQTRNNPKHID